MSVINQIMVCSYGFLFTRRWVRPQTERWPRLRTFVGGLEPDSRPLMKTLHVLYLRCKVNLGNSNCERSKFRKFEINLRLMLRLHYVTGGHGSHDFGHRGRNGVTVTQRRGTGSTNVVRRGRRDRRDRFLNSQKICHGSHGGIDLLKCAVVERGERNKTWQNVTDLNTTWSMSVAGLLVTRRQPKVCQGLSRSTKFCCGLPRFPSPTPQLEPEHGV